MRRLVASEEEIQAAEEAMALEPVLVGDQVEHFTEQEKDRYRRAAQAARAEARRESLREMMADKVRETKAWYREEREREISQAAEV
ncbi:MAG: hypothetical protein Q9Q40_14355 [Acidobacteriota bacterium]|nr:hypothetical protein [Acidobacteriota bacterium]